MHGWIGFFTLALSNFINIVPSKCRRHDKPQSEGDPSILRCLESRALFAGYVAQLAVADTTDATAADAAAAASNAAAGAFVTRWCVVAPRVTVPGPGRPVGTVRMELLVYDDWDRAQPKMQVGCLPAVGVGVGGLIGLSSAPILVGFSL